MTETTTLTLRMRENTMDEIEFDVTWDLRSNQHKILIDTGEYTVYLTRNLLQEMLEALGDAEESA